MTKFTGKVTQRQVIQWFGLAGAILVLPACHLLDPSDKTPPGVPLNKVIDQIKTDLSNSNVADIKVGDGKVKACGKENDGKPLVLMRSGETPPQATVKLSITKVTDVTVSTGVSKLPVLGILFTADVSFESKRQSSTEQDITFNVVRPMQGGADPLVVAVQPEKYSELGNLISQTEQAILAVDHALEPCLQPAKLSVNVAVDVNRTVGADGSIGFALLYSVTAKGSRAKDTKSQVQIDLTYDKATVATFQDRR